jgi:hypothetical protein
MKVLTCAATRRRLNAFLDRELPVAEQIAVSAHLDWCEACAGLSADLQAVGTALRAAAPARTSVPLSAEEAASFHAMVVARVMAERHASIAACVRGMFDDFRLVYVGLSATVAAIICLTSMAGMMRFSTEHRPDSLAAILNVMATPFECEGTSEVPDTSECRARWVERFERANESAEQDAVLTLDAIVARDGGLTNLAVLRTSRVDARGQAEVVEELLDTVSRARSATRSTDLVPNILRVVARETVRAAKQPPLDLQLPPSKPAASLPARHPATA